MQLKLFEPNTLPDFSECFQYEPWQRTAEAAAARKAISPWPLKNSFIADLNGYRVTQDMLRHPSGPTVPQLVKVGNVVKTSYGSGPYVVTKIIQDETYGVETWHLACGQYSLNEYVGVDGRILHLFLANDDEVFVTEAKPAPGSMF